jgi:CRISPR type III-A-associated protein Csm2
VKAPYRGGSNPRQEHRTNVQVLFDPGKPDAELFDALAEKQAEQLQINSNQLRRFFGELKELYRQFNALVANEAGDEKKQEAVYRLKIEPRFKMIRSKVAYATRAGGQSKLPAEFAQFFQEGIQKVTDHRQFVRFVMHVEAVVGFMYGKGKVRQ